MKAYLLAAGYGTRLRPITDTIPKCLAPIHGMPLLAWWFALLCRHGVTDVLINTHYLRGQVRAFLDDYNHRHMGLTAHESYEPELLGSGGAILSNRDFVKGEESFLICYADNLTNVDLTDFVKFHHTHDGILSMGLFHTNKPEQCGIVELDREGCVRRFTEKPAHPQSNLANAGLYVADQRLFDQMDSEKPPLDLGKDVIPKLVGHMYGWLIKGYLVDVGTIENYQKANEEWTYDHHENTFTD